MTDVRQGQRRESPVSVMIFLFVDLGFFRHVIEHQGYQWQGRGMLHEFVIVESQLRR